MLSIFLVIITSKDIGKSSNLALLPFERRLTKHNMLSLKSVIKYTAGIKKSKSRLLFPFFKLNSILSPGNLSI